MNDKELFVYSIIYENQEIEEIKLKYLILIFNVLYYNNTFKYDNYFINYYSPEVNELLDILLYKKYIDIDFNDKNEIIIYKKIDIESIHTVFLENIDTFNKIKNMNCDSLRYSSIVCGTHSKYKINDFSYDNVREIITRHGYKVKEDKEFYNEFYKNIKI